MSIPLSPLLRHVSRRRCDVCGGRYFSRGQCEFAPVCPRALGRRRELDMPQAQRLWASFQDVLVAYARAVILWMNGEIEIAGLPHWRCLWHPLR